MSQEQTGFILIILQIIIILLITQLLIGIIVIRILIFLHKIQMETGLLISILKVMDFMVLEKELILKIHYLEK
ncbi:Uncharacterised protein [uncultured archaeon]|nr:Uncharacterised protein [uncultured archaeon]